MTEFIKKTGMETGELPRHMGISARLAKLLYARGCRTAEDMEQFLHPGVEQLLDPFLFEGMRGAVDIINEAIKLNKRISIYGDYDADGVCATAILMDALKCLGADVSFRIPSRHSEGYGMNLSAVDELFENGAQLIITVDNGIKANAEIARCRELGMDVVITDHHKTGMELPDANAIICHTAERDGYPNRNICGAGTAYKLACALLGDERAKRYLPLAALATAADAVPLTGENRAMVALGLNMINRRECCIGLLAIASAAGSRNGGYNSRDLVFQFAPRINAAGRMEDAGQCVELLLETDEAAARRMAERLNELNALRQNDEGEIVRDAYGMVERMDITRRRAIVLNSESWNPGVAGIAASRVAEKFFRPTVLLARDGDTLTGSARSIKGIDLYAALAACEDCFVRFGGHEYAAGLTINADRLDEFIARFDAALARMYSDDVLLPTRTYEEDAELGEMTMRLAEEIEQLAPFGEGNPQPTFVTRGVTLNRLSRFGSKGQYVRAMGMKDDCYAELVGFSMGSRFDELMDMERADILYTPDINEFRGTIKLQLQLYDARRCSVSEPDAYIDSRKDKFLNAICRNILYNDSRDGVRAENCTDDTVKRLLNQRRYGTAVMCFTPEGAKRLLGLTGGAEDVELGFYKNLRSPAAYNAVILAPVLDELTLSRFDDIAVYDMPLTRGMEQKLRAAAPRAEIYAPGEGAGSTLFLELAANRERFVPYYKAMAAGGGFYNRESAADYLQEKAGGPRCMAELMLSIMLELGFASEGKRVEFVRDAAKRELSESPTFNAMNRLAGGRNENK